MSSCSAPTLNLFIKKFGGELFPIIETKYVKLPLRLLTSDFIE